MLLGRLFNIYICSKLANISRRTDSIDGKKGFFLWFAGVRGAMAFALAIKSKIDFVSAGPIFLVITLIIISFTLLYSTFLLESTLRSCDIIISTEHNMSFEEDDSLREHNLFEVIKGKLSQFHISYLKPYVTRVEDTLSQDKSEMKQNEELKEMEKDTKDVSEDKSNVDSKVLFKKSEKIKTKDESIDKKNFHIKNIHLFE
jgi:NhaP-type Na+/H+ or K+/H+ antiporter